MKHVINILGLFFLLLGFVMAADTPWGWAVASVPLVYWLVDYLVFIHKSRFAAVIFWSGVAYLSWQLAIGALLVFWVVYSFKNAEKYGRKSVASSTNKKFPQINPTTGRPMMGSGVDIDGTPYKACRPRY